MGRPT